MRKIINNNRDIIDITEPDEGHFEKFKNKLEQRNKTKNKRFVISDIFKYAAVSILFLLCSFMTYKYFSTKNMYENKLSFQKNVFRHHSPEYQEAGIYFTSEINSKIETISELNFNNNRLEKEILLNELTEADSLFTELQTDLNTNPDDERVINAIINHYQTKLKVLNQIINQLKNVKQSKIKYHEEIEI